MCLACEQEDLYFLYLERLEQARRAAFGEKPAANPNWMWGSAPAPAAAPAEASRATPKSAFVCDTPE
jgi:hypothetical protein